MQNAKFKMQNAECRIKNQFSAFRFPLLSLTSKSSMMRLFLCDAKRQIRSIVNLCEEFGD